MRGRRLFTGVNIIWLHGVRDGRFVHVGSVDAPVSRGVIKALVEELWANYGRDTLQRVDVLGWDFAFEIDTTVRQIEREGQIKISCKRIPREVLERKAKEEVDIRFFELAALDIEVHQRQDRSVTVTLIDFIVPTEAFSNKVQQVLREWHQWIDYWAVDWNYKYDEFHNMTQVYRTGEGDAIQINMDYIYKEPGTYTIAVKVIDVQGNDTTTTTEVEVY